MTYTNSELFPQRKRGTPPNTSIDSVIKGSGNIIDSSSRNTVVNGDANYVGEQTSNINIFNSSGCVVSSGVIGCVLINSSGIVVSDNNLVYINNQLFTAGSVSSDGYRKVTINTTAIQPTDGTIDVQYSGGIGIYYLPSPVGHFRKYTIKNNSPTFHDQDVWCYSFTIDNATSGGAGKVTLAYLDSITVQSDGSANYLII